VSDRIFLDKVAIAAELYCKRAPENEAQIDDFLFFIFKTYGYSDYLKTIKKINSETA
jgi:hypothetical protein